MILALAAALLFADPSIESAASAKLTYLREGDAMACPDEGIVRSGIAQRLGYEPFDPFAAREVRARVRREGRGFSASVQLLDEKGQLAGERQLSSQSDDCSEIAASMQLAIALAIDPLVLSRPAVVPAPSSPPPPPSIEVEPRPPPPPKPPPAPPPEPKERTRLELGAGMLASAGHSITATGSPLLAAALRFSGSSLGLELRFDLESSSEYDGGFIATSAAELSFVPCVRERFFGICGVASAGVLYGHGVAYLNPRDTSTPLFELGARLFLEGHLTRWLSVRLQADGQASFARTNLVVGNFVAWSSSPLVGSVGISMVGTLPIGP